jgi:hypothetical protein
VSVASLARQLWHQVSRWWPFSRRPTDTPTKPYYMPAFDRRLPRGWASYSPDGSRRKSWIARRRSH